MNKAVIGLGSNINPEMNIRKALEIISKSFELIAESELIFTKPVGFEDQTDYLNGTVAVETELDIDSFKEVLSGIETGLGRKRGANSFGPRTIDLDVIVWNGEVIDPDFHKRDFLKDATLEVLPELRY